MTTNIPAIVTITLLTNYSELLHPSGEEKKCIRRVEAEHVTRYEWQGRQIVTTNFVTVSSNTVRKVWMEVKDKPERQPLTVQDNPPAFPK